MGDLSKTLSEVLSGQDSGRMGSHALLLTAVVALVLAQKLLKGVDPWQAVRT
jgi:hypothetical protein